MASIRAVRAEALERNPTCQLCGYRRATEVHHWCYPRGALAARHHRLVTLARRFMRGTPAADADGRGRRMCAAFQSALDALARELEAERAGA